MPPPAATAPSPAAERTTRVARSARRDALLDVAARIVAEAGVEHVTMESVAVGSHVSRGLVYKHFQNRHDLVTALYERESTHLHVQLAAAVRDATTLAEMLGALVRGALVAQAARGATFAALSAGGGRDARQRDLQRRRDGETLAHFTRVAVTELGLAESDARAGLAMALGALSVVLAQWRRRPTDEHAAHLEHTYVAMTMGGLRALSEGTDGPLARTERTPRHGNAVR